MGPSELSLWPVFGRQTTGDPPSRVRVHDETPPDYGNSVIEFIEYERSLERTYRDSERRKW